MFELLSLIITSVTSCESGTASALEERAECESVHGYLGFLAFSASGPSAGQLAAWPLENSYKYPQALVFRHDVSHELHFGHLWSHTDNLYSNSFPFAGMQFIISHIHHNLAAKVTAIIYDGSKPPDSHKQIFKHECDVHLTHCTVLGASLFTQRIVGIFPS